MTYATISWTTIGLVLVLLAQAVAPAVAAGERGRQGGHAMHGASDCERSGASCGSRGR